MPSIAIVAFHMYPDPEVGAKRVSELANHLAGSGWAVAALAQTTQVADPSRRLGEKIACVRIQQPLPLALRILRVLRRFSPFGSGTASPRSVVEVNDDDAQSGALARPLANLEWHYHRIVGALDNTKNWSMKAVLAFYRNRTLSEAQAILVSGPPWSPVFAASLVGRLRRLPVLVDFRDPWLDRVREPREYHGIRRWVDAYCEAFCVRHARVVTVTTEAFGKTLSKRYPQYAGKILVIRNGYDEGLVISSAAPTGVLSMLYAGTIYMSRNPMPLLQGIGDLLAMPDVDRTRVRLRLVGDCEQWNGRRLADVVRDLAIDDVVSILPPVTGPRVRELTIEANVVVNFAQGHPEQVPAKLYEQFVSNRYGLLFAEAHSESAIVAGAVDTIFRLDDSATQVLGVLRNLYDELVVCGRAPPLSATASAHSRSHSNQRFEQVLRQMLPDS